MLPQHLAAGHPQHDHDFSVPEGDVEPHMVGAEGGYPRGPVRGQEKGRWVPGMTD